MTHMQAKYQVVREPQLVVWNQLLVLTIRVITNLLALIEAALEQKWQVKCMWKNRRHRLYLS